MKLLNTGFYESKGSKFYAYLYHMNTFDEYKLVLDEVRSFHKKANHLCYSLCFEGEVKFSNDGEVGEPARFMNFYLEQNNLDSHMLVVSRIFGGIKLGVGGVSRSFREAVKDLS